MNKKLDLSEILKNCPKGTKFYSPAFGELTLDCITGDKICLKDYQKFNRIYKKNGKYIYCDETAEIDLLPSKDQRDWSKWHRPFVDGDVVTYENQIGIFKKYIFEDDRLVECYVFLDDNLGMCIGGDYYVEDFATEKEKQKLFDVIKEHGYSWNTETKTLEKLIVPKFKVGDIIQDEDKYKVKITEVSLADEVYGYESLIAKGIGSIAFSEQNDWKLVPNKFDPSTLKPFDKVLGKSIKSGIWKATSFSHCLNGLFCCSLVYFDLCIPYNDDTAHLVGTDKEAPEYYRYWED